jgi:hypothetical protein
VAAGTCEDRCSADRRIPVQRRIAQETCLTQPTSPEIGERGEPFESVPPSALRSVRPGSAIQAKNAGGTRRCAADGTLTEWQSRGESNGDKRWARSFGPSDGLRPCLCASWPA